MSMSDSVATMELLNSKRHHYWATTEDEMKIPVVLSLAALALGLCVPSASAHECKVVCDAAHSAPVCGSNGKTYASQCFLEFAKCETPKLTLAHEGACPSTKTKAKTIHISIGKKKETKEALDHDVDADDDEEDEDEDEDEGEHDNKKAKAATKKSKCDKDCTREFEQLCASDGKTYNNHCLYEIALCNNASLTIVNEDGACPSPVLKATQDDDEEEESEDGEEGDDAEGEPKEEKKDKCLKGCSREFEPLCASDGKTYNNHCLFEIAQCRNSSLTITNADDACSKK